MKLSDLPEKEHPPETPQPIAWTVGKILPVLMLLAKRQDQLFFHHLELERHILKMNAGFVLTSFEQAALFKMETHNLIADLNSLSHHVDLWKPIDNQTAPDPEK